MLESILPFDEHEIEIRCALNVREVARGFGSRLLNRGSGKPEHLFEGLIEVHPGSDAIQHIATIGGKIGRQCLQLERQTGCRAPQG